MMDEIRGSLSKLLNNRNVFKLFFLPFIKYKKYLYLPLELIIIIISHVRIYISPGGTSNQSQCPNEEREMIFYIHQKISSRRDKQKSRGYIIVSFLFRHFYFIYINFLYLLKKRRNKNQWRSILQDAKQIKQMPIMIK